MSRCVLRHLFANNQAWAAEMTRQDPTFFPRLSQQQSPQYLWIGCSDSRVPTNQIVGLQAGQMFVHRNVANVVVRRLELPFGDPVRGRGPSRGPNRRVWSHGCGGVLAALRDDRLGLVDNWLRHVQDVRRAHQAQIDVLHTETDRHNRLCELNVIEQVINASQTTVVRDAWTRGQSLAVHRWVYDVHDGLLCDLGICITAEGEVPTRSDAARAKASV